MTHTKPPAIAGPIRCALPADAQAHSVTIEQAWIVDQNAIFTTLAQAQAHAQELLQGEVA